MNFVEKYLVNKVPWSKFLVAVVLLLLTAASAFLRFTNLGYSEFQDDEKKAIIRKSSDEITFNFLLNQRKGPLQFLVTQSVLQITHDPRNEIALRLPFAILNLGSVLVFYLLIKKITTSSVAGFFGAMIYSANGFIIGFSRIAQYQNLNLFFSLLAVYFFAKINDPESKPLRNSLLGTLAISLSLLAHWDAIFFIFPIAVFLIEYLIKSEDTKHTKVKLVLLNILVGSLVLLPFLVPYIYTQAKHQSNQDYFTKRVGVNTVLQDKIDNHKHIFYLYNPFFTIYILAVGALISLASPKKSSIYVVWTILNFLLILYFMKKPGTHIYNYVIPILFLYSLGIKNLVKLKKIAYFSLPIVLLATAALYVQAYKIFVDHTQEYPWDNKEIFRFKEKVLSNKEYKNSEIITFGFPHFRNWKEINEITLREGKECTYITNEGKEISQIYMDLNYGKSDDMPCYFVIQIKRPFITRGADAIFAEAKDKYLVYKYKNKNDETLAKVYKIPNKKYNLATTTN